MRWEDESYIRIYVRDTPDLAAMGWEARAVLWEVFRKMDRAGILELGKSGRRGLAGVTGIPLEVVNRGMDILLEDGVLSMQGTHVFCKNFTPAQECTKSDKLRQKEHRAKARASEMSQDVTEPSQDVTESHARSQVVTPGHAVSLCAVPCSSTPISAKEPARPRDPCSTEHQEPPANEPGKPTARNVVEKYLAIRSELVVGHVQGANGLGLNPQPGEVEKAAAWIANMTPEECVDIEPAIRLTCQHVKDGAHGWTDPRMVKVGFLFACIVQGWSDLREELHNCAPKAKPVNRFGHPEPERTVTHSRYR